jgi:hypothetical protein
LFLSYSSSELTVAPQIGKMAKANLSRLRIVVTGLVGTFPLGGVYWDYLQYALGFLLLGHEVLYLEDTGRWCYDPEAQTFVESGSSSRLRKNERFSVEYIVG